VKYIVMECHVSYAVVLDEDGRFLNVANMNYQVGQTVTDVVEIGSSGFVAVKKRNRIIKWIGSIAAIAACVVLTVVSLAQFTSSSPYGSVYVTINPEVRIDVDRDDCVVDLAGINADGVQLIDGYSYDDKHIDLVMDELVDRAISMGFLHEGDQITLTFDAEDGEWVVNKRDSLSTHLSEHLNKVMSVTIQIGESTSPGENNPETVSSNIRYDDDEDDENDDDDDDDYDYDDRDDD